MSSSLLDYPSIGGCFSHISISPKLEHIFYTQKIFKLFSVKLIQVRQYMEILWTNLAKIITAVEGLVLDDHMIENI